MIAEQTFTEYQSAYSLCMATLQPYLAEGKDKLGDLDVVFFTLPYPGVDPRIHVTNADIPLAGVAQTMQANGIAGICFPILTKRKFRREVILKLQSLATSAAQGGTA